MKITKRDLIDINTFEIPYFIDEWGCIILQVPGFNIWINKRPHYCDRGRYGFHAVGRQGKVGKIDVADFFPRYFFSLQNAFNEVQEYIEFNKVK